MKVYNLTDGRVRYKGKTIPPNGGFQEYPGLSNLPPRDLLLEENKVLSFGSLPEWFKKRKAKLAKARKPSLRMALVELPKEETEE